MVDDLTHLDRRVIVLHGQTNDSGAYLRLLERLVRVTRESAVRFASKAARSTLLGPTHHFAPAPFGSPVLGRLCYICFHVERST